MGSRSAERPIVGRDDEVTVLVRAVMRATDGEPSVVLVSGDPGIGKSSLLDEAARRANVELYAGRCVHVGGDAIPLAPVVDLVRQIERRGAPDKLPALARLVDLATSGDGRTGDVFSLALDLV